MHRMSSSGQPTRGVPRAWRLGEVLTTAHSTNLPFYEMFTQKASDLDWHFDGHKLSIYCMYYLPTLCLILQRTFYFV